MPGHHLLKFLIHAGGSVPTVCCNPLGVGHLKMPPANYARHVSSNTSPRIEATVPCYGHTSIRSSSPMALFFSNFFSPAKRTLRFRGQSYRRSHGVKSGKQAPPARVFEVDFSFETRPLECRATRIGR